MTMDWREEFFEFDDVTYLNLAAQAPLPRVAAKALQKAIEWKKQPHRIPEELFFGLPNRVRTLLARLVNGMPEEIALTTGASGGLLAVARGIDWKPEDEVLIAAEEFPAHFSTFVPLADARRLRVKIVQPAGRFLTAEDFLAQMGSRTRLVSTSLVRFNDAARIDAARLAEGCRKAGAWLLLDASQAVGAVPIDVATLGADFLVASGYKWLLGPFGTGFFWIRESLIEQIGGGPFYWMATTNAHDFSSLSRGNWKPECNARRWDTPETASFFNLAAFEASLELVLRVGPEAVWQHNDGLLRQLIDALPRDRCVLASPEEPAASGPYACIAGRTPAKTAELYEKLRAAGIVVSLRQNAVRISPYLYNTEGDIDRLRMILAV
jgi:selenocysteine lyase/cysteine desulfurase